MGRVPVTSERSDANPQISPSFRDRVVELRRVRAGDLVANPSNWRRHPKRQREALQGILADVGYADALLARRDGSQLVLVDGQLRQSMDPDQVVLVLDVDEREADLLLATLDPLAALATSESQALADLLSRVESSSAAVGELLGSLAHQAGVGLRALHTDPDHLPEVASEPRTVPGDLWLLGEHRLLCGDATDRAAVATLMDGHRAQVLWTDPPYGVEYVGKTPQALRIAGDRADGLGALLNEAFGAAGEVLHPGAGIYVCHPAGREALVFLEAFSAQGWRLHQGLVWVKDSMVLGHADYHYRHEPIAFGYAPGGGRRGRGGAGWHGGHDQDTVLEVPRPAASREHPTMKPVELVRRCLHNSSVPGQVVLDPFAGSGTTLVACHVLGRRGFGMELDPRYCDVAVRRFEELTGTEAVRVSRGSTAGGGSASRSGG
jgi:DNA modification methylase